MSLRTVESSLLKLTTCMLCLCMVGEHPRAFNVTINDLVVTACGLVTWVATNIVANVARVSTRSLTSLFSEWKVLARESTALQGRLILGIAPLCTALYLDCTQLVSVSSSCVVWQKRSLEPGPIQERGPGRDCMRMRQNSQKTGIKVLSRQKI